MRRPTRTRTACLLFLLAASALAAAAPTGAVEGKWTPEQVLELDPAWLRELGLEIAPGELWGREGAGLLEAAVRVPGCSAGFISAEGLLITNHHCAFPILQQHSSPERNLIADGFLASRLEEELAGGGVRATVPHTSRDVTAEIRTAVPRGADDLQRFRAIEQKQKELVAACERRENRRCELATFDGGVQYLLFESLELPDVRLVYAPPRAVGEYGGEVDNWSWPRHTGDFALMRVWAAPDGRPAPGGDANAPEGNAPYRPRHHFPVSPRGVEPGAFVMMAGYPGQTYRSFTEAEMRERAERFFPGRAAMYRAWLDLMERPSGGEAARIALADRVKSLANREKNARGQVAGIRRADLIGRKRAEEEAVLAQAAGRPELRGAIAAHAELARLMEARLRTWDRDFLLAEVRNGPKPLDLALTLARWARERARPDLEREPDYQERNRERLEERLRLDQKRFHLPTEEALLRDLLGRFAALPEASRVPAVERLLAGERQAGEVRARAAALLAGSRVVDLEERMRMAGESLEQLRARRDPLLDFALALDEELLAWKEREDRFKGALARLRPTWRQAVAVHAGKPLAPDANGTLRVTFGQVKGYAPRDAVWMEPQTTLAGLVEKHTGEEPFDVPDAVLAAAPAALRSPWAAPKLGDVPVCFLADADTTGGSSGSPVLNGRGELVGVNFDRVWENVANDFGYLPDVGRNISVDVRYLLWMLDGLHGEAARPLLRELLGESGMPPAAGAAASGSGGR